MMIDRTKSTETPAAILELENESELDDVLEREDRVLVDFYADWCGPCQMMEGTIETVSETVDAIVVKVDIEAFPGIAARFDVSSIPTFIAFDGESPDGRLVGMQDEKSVRQLAV